MFAFIIALFGAQPAAIAQVVGGTTYTVGVDFATFADAITNINNGISGTGTITINVPRGITYTGVLPTLNATNTSATPIVIQASGTGAAPIIQPTLNAGTIGTALLGANGDAVLRINGTDFITLNGLEFRANNDGSATATTRIEYGVFLVKSATNACQNITIQNCAFTNFQGGATSQFTIAIYQSNLNASGAAVTVTSTGGRCENNRYYGNTINGPYHGIALLGFNDATAPNTFYDQNCEVGGYGAGTGNTITGFGGAAANVFGIFAGNQNNALISLNTLTGSTTTAQINGIVSTGAVTSITIPGTSSNRNASTTIRQNTITLTATGAAAANNLQAIFQNAGGAAGTFANIDSNTVQNCSGLSLTTANVRLLFSEFGASGEASTSNIRGNVFNNNNWSGTGTSFIIREFGFVPNVNITGNTITNTTITTTTTGSLTVINAFTAPGATHNINNNIISNIAYAGPATTPTITCINNQSANISTINGNRITDISSTGTSPTLRGIANSGGATSLSIQQDTIKRFTTTSTTSPILNGIANTATVTGVISRCQIDSLSANSATTSPSVSGITSSGASTTGLVISRNNILRLTANAGATPTVVGITVSGGMLTTLHNNYLVNLFANAANATNAIIGLNITGGPTVNAYYNTIYIEATSTGANFGSSGIFASTTPTLDLRNNVVVNRSTPNGTGLTVAYRRITTTLTTYASTSDRNLFFAGTPSSTRLIFNDGTSSDQTLAAFKTRVGPTRDANSVTENPPFTDPSTNNFAINTSAPTGIESRGAPITGITTDFFGTTRSASTPDIGAEEGSFTFLDEVPPVISYTLLTNTASLSNRVLTGFATITDPTPVTGVNTTSGTRPRIYYKKSTNPNSVSGWQFTEATNASSPFDFTIDYSLLGGVSAGDVIQYFVVAQDLATTPNVGINSGTFAATPSSVALTAAAFPIGGTINSYTIVLPPLSGAYTVGTGGDYASITAAVADLNSRGVSGPVTFNLTNATYSETFPITINQFTGASATNRVTIKPAVGNTATISGSSATSIFRLNGADFVTIDGSNNGTTTRDMTITNTNTVTNTAAIWVSSLGAGQGATDVEIKNLNLRAGANTPANNTFGVYVGGTTIPSAGADNDNLLIENNVIDRASRGIEATGTAAVSSGGLDNLVIRLNEIGSATPANFITRFGILVAGAVNPLVTRNTVFNITIDPGIVAIAGIALDANIGTGAVISRNLVDSVNNTNSGGYQSYGINVASGTVRIENNVITRIRAEGDGTAAGPNINTTFNPFGIRIAGGTGHQVYFNSVRLTGAFSRSNSGSACLLVLTGASSVNVRNNIFANQMTGTTVNTYAVMTTGTPITTLNFNDYFVTGTGGFLGSIAGTHVSALPLITGQDANSITSNPQFNSITNLQPQLASPVLGAGTPILGITTDFLGVTRSASTPTIGAFEEGVDVVPPSIAYTPLTNTASLSNRVLTGFATITDVSGVNTTPSTRPRIYYKKSGDPNTVAGWQFTEATNASSPFDFTIDYSLLGGVATGDVIQYFLVAQDLATTPNVGINSGTFAATPSSVALTAAAFPIGGTINSYTITPALPTAITVGTGGDYPTLTGAGGLFQAINTNVLGGNTTVTIISDLTEDGANALLPDGMAGFTLTIQPSGARTVSGAVAGAMLDFNGADGVTLNGLNSGGNSLTISNTSTATTASTIRFRSDATNNTVTNCTIEGSNTNTDESAATILIGTGTSSGNDNITISNNTIRAAGGNLQNFAVTSAGTAGAVNDGLTFTNNNVEGYLIGLRAVTNVGNNITVTGNSFYQPTTITATTLNFFDLIVGAATSNNVNVSNNFVGGNAPNATGTATRSAIAQYIGIFVTTGGGTNAVNNNVVRGVAMTSTGLTTQSVIGYVLNGTMTATNNLAQDISRSSGSTGVMTGIQLQSAGNITLTNSTVRGLNYNAATATGALNGISVIATGTESVSGCTVQNLTHTGNGTTNGINSSGTVTSHTFNSNVVRALSGTNTGTTAQVRGIVSTAVGTLNITNNQVRNLTAATGAIGDAPTGAAVAGIVTNAANLTQTITDNRIDTLNATNTTAAVRVFGVGVENTGGGGTIARNRVFRLSATSSGTPFLDGINVWDASNWTVANNLVSITNGTGTNAVTIRGLRSDALSGTVNFFYNSVFVGGSAASGTANSFGFMRTSDGATLNLRNNNLFNARTGGTGAHVAIGRTGTSTFNSNYNVIFASASPAQQAFTTAAVNFSSWQTATSGDANSVNQNPLYHSPLNLAPLPGSPSNNAGTPIAVTTDILGNARSASTPDIGAFEFAGATPTGSGSASAPTWGPIPGAFLTINSGPSSGTVTAQFFTTGRTGTLPGVLNQAQEYWAISSDVTGSFDVTFDLSGIGGVANLSTVKLFRRSDPFSAWEDISSLIYDRPTSPNRLSLALASGFSEFTLGGDGDNPLPVNLGAFTGVNIPRGVELRWETISETDNAGFDVRRAEVIDGVQQEWLTVASYRSTPSLAGQGTTSQAHNYRYVDEGVQVSRTYRYALRSTDLDGVIHDYPQTVTVEVTRLAPRVFVYKLEQNYPNPFNPSTRIIYQVAATSDVKVEIFDMLGRKVATLVNERKEAGEYSVNFNANGLSSGVYFYRLQTDKFTQTKKMMLVK